MPRSSPQAVRETGRFDSAAKWHTEFGKVPRASGTTFTASRGAHRAPAARGPLYLVPSAGGLEQGAYELVGPRDAVLEEPDLRGRKSEHGVAYAVVEV